MTQIYKGYVKTKNKKCIEKFKGAGTSELHTKTEFDTWDEGAGILADDIVLIDIDDEKQSDIFYEIVQARELCCRVVKTTRGRHFIFKNSAKSSEGVKSCKTGTKLACGLSADIKIGAHTSYEILKYKGVERVIEWDIDEDAGEDYQEVPKFCYPVKCDIDFLTLGAGEGRNQSLFNYILTLQGNGFTVDETREAIRLINDYVLPNSLDESELEVVLRDDAFKAPAFFKGAKFLFDKFAIYMKNQCHVVTINGQLHIYEDGIYKPGIREIEREMIKVIPSLSDAKRKEVLKYMQLCCEPIEPADARYIAFKNCLYDIATDSTIEFTPDVVITNRIPWDYMPDVYDELADHTLNKIACGDKHIRAILEECIGYCFYRRNELGKAFMLTGTGANGKSTFLDVVTTILGQDNISALDLGELGDRFSTSMLFGRLANIGDDIGDDFLQGTQVAIFKKIVTGNRIKAEQKGQDPFEFNPYVKLLFSANDIPRMKDKTNAVLRRLIIIPFNAHFSKDDPDYEPFIKYKLIEPQAIQYMITLGVKGLRRVLEVNDFTSSVKVAEKIEEYREENNPVLGFIKEFGEDSITNEAVADVYRNYSVYCAENSLTPLGRTMFSKQIRREIPKLDVGVRKIQGRSVRIFILGVQS